MTEKRIGVKEVEMSMTEELKRPLLWCQVLQYFLLCELECVFMFLCEKYCVVSIMQCVTGE